MPTGPRRAARANKGWRSTMVPGDIYDWQVRVKLPSFATPFIRAKFLGPLVPSQRGRRRKRRAYLREVGGYGEGASPAEARAIDYLEANEAALCDIALRTLARDAQASRADWQARLGPAAAEVIVPRRMTPEQAAERVEFTHVEISERARDGIAYVALHGECLWEDHGFVVVFHRKRVVDVCQPGTGWVDRERRRRRSP